MKNGKNIIIGCLLVAIMGMSIGYAALAQTLTINGSADVTTAKWDVRFTKITEKTMSGAVASAPPTFNVTTATFAVDLKAPGSYAIYEIEVSNNGSIDAVLDSLTDLTVKNGEEPKDIVYTITGIKATDSLAAAGKTVFQVKVEWLLSSTTIPTVKQKTATINLNYVQKTA